MKSKPGLSARTVGIISVIFGVWQLPELIMATIALMAMVFTNKEPLTEWQSTPEFLICTLFIIGGLGLIYGKPRGRFLVMAGAIVSVLTGVLEVFLLPLDNLDESILWFSFFGLFLFNGLLDAVLLYIAWSVKLPSVLASGGDGLPHADPINGESELPDKLHSSPLKASRKVMLDIAYACFGWIGVTALLIPLISMLPLDFSQVQGLGMLVLLPLSIVAMPAALVGAVLSLILWREWPLPLMTMLGTFATALMASYMISEETGCLLVALAYLGFALRWWLVTRKGRTWD